MSVGKMAAELQAGKVGGKKSAAARPSMGKSILNWAEGQNFFYLQLCQPVDMLPFNLKRPIVNLEKDLDLSFQNILCPSI